MHPVYPHLMVNHLPIVGSLLALVLVALALRGDRGMLRAAVVVLGISALGGIAAWRSGEAAEEFMEDRPGISEEAIESHEAPAVAAAGALLLATALGVVLLVAERRRGALPPHGVPALLVLTVLAAALMGWMGRTGGQINHPELQESPGG